MSTAEFFEVELFEPSQLITACTALPLSVSACTDEVLASWLLRYAAPLAVPPEILLLDRADTRLIERADWWRRPDPLLLARLSARTGLPTAALAAMTFLDFSPQNWHEEVYERFARWRFQLPRSTRRSRHRLAICPQCLAEDATPYVRKLWTLGWAGVCEVHACRLLGKCPQCRQTLQLPSLSADQPFAPHQCARCSFHLSTAAQFTAHPLSLRLQALLLANRPRSAVPLPGVGILEWPVAMAFFDLLLGMVWNGPKNRFRQQLFAHIHRELDLTEDLGTGHYTGLLILAWLLDQWPQHLCLAMATLKTPCPRQQIQRWPRLDPAIKRSIQQISIPAWPRAALQESTLGTLPVSPD
jgi:hypothetical protein